MDRLYEYRGMDNEKASIIALQSLGLFQCLDIEMNTSSVGFPATMKDCD